MYLRTSGPREDWACAFGQSDQNLYLAYFSEPRMQFLHTTRKTDKTVCLSLLPSGHMASIQRHLNVDATSWRCIDIEVTLYRRHDVAATLRWRCINVMCLFGMDAHIRSYVFSRYDWDDSSENGTFLHKKTTLHLEVKVSILKFNPIRIKTNICEKKKNIRVPLFLFCRACPEFLLLSFRLMDVITSVSDSRLICWKIYQNTITNKVYIVWLKSETTRQSSSLYCFVSLL